MEAKGNISTAEEIDLSFAIQLQAQLEEGTRVQRKNDEKKKPSESVEKMNANEEIDLSLAIQLQAQLEEEARLESIKDEESKIYSESIGINNANEEIDLSLAIQLQAQFEEEARVQRLKDEENQKSSEFAGYKFQMGGLPETEQKKMSVSLVDPSWEYVDPTPNIYVLFQAFNYELFWGRLMGVEVKWSPRMTLCAGVCSYEGKGRLCSVRLSEPLLKLRPRKDLIETLLHEMIHAYLFVTDQNTDHDGHGPQFLKHMYRINKLTGTNITVYHSFHDEVDVYRQHIWQCDGPCRKRPPYFGLVKRSMNRPPSSRDVWWERHVKSCGGMYTKIQEPEGYGQPKTKRKVKGESSKDIRSFFPVSGNKKLKSLGEEEKKKGSGEHSGAIKKKPKETSSNSANVNIAAGVKRLDIQNASNSSVHGFSSLSSQKVNGSGNFKGIVKGSSTSLRTSSGSKTVLVGKKKSNPKNNGETVCQPRETFSSFSGTGHTLGSTTSSGRSRLLSKFDQSVAKVRSKKVESGPSCNGNAVENSLLCPVCQNSYDSNEHSAFCLSDIDFNSDIEPSSNLDCHNDRSDSALSADSRNNSNFKDNKFVLSDNKHHPTSVEKNFPCPVCNENFKESVINDHVSRHFN